MTASTAPVLHLVTSRRRLAPDARTERQAVRALQGLLVEGVQAGVDVIQIRERDLDARLLYELTCDVVRLAEGTSTRVLVNDRADVAAAAGAAGVHLPASGLRAGLVRSLADCWTIGRSVHAGDVVEGDLLDYVLFGTVFPSESKGNDVEVAEVQGLATAAASIRLPVIAIGGITPERAAACRAAGAAGVAAIGVFLPPGSARGAMGVEAAVAAFRRAW